MAGEVVRASRREAAVNLDRADPLRKWRSEFQLPDDVIYLNANSLGPPPNSARTALLDVHREWQADLGRAWGTAGWFEAPVRIGDKAGRLIGAGPGQAIVSDSTSINLYKLLHAALALRPDRDTILIEKDTFPTDAYIASEVARQTGKRIRSLERSRLIEGASEADAVVVLTHVHYKTGELSDLDGIAKAAHSKGTLVLADLSHSIGVVPTQLDEWGIDFAVAATYKYLNGGPGSPAVAYVRTELQEQVQTPLPGWMSHRSPLSFAGAYEPDPGIRHLLVGTPPIVGYAPLEAAIDLALKVDVEAVRRKSSRLSQFFIDEIDARLRGRGVRLVSPRDPAQRGSHVSIAHPSAGSLIQEVGRIGIVADHRPPDLLRFSFGPLYNRYVEIWDAVDRLGGLLRDSTN